MSYYELSSSDRSEDDESDQSDKDTDQCSKTPSDNPQHHLWSRSIVHIDVDCFYCQCEQVDGPPDYRKRPLAIGQKHIIVTSNYLARDFGVKKLQSREDALRACPSLLILEGSDLERYRRHSRNIYLGFREEMQAIGRKYGVIVPVRKGGMDEALADLTELVNAAMKQDCGLPSPLIYIYGSDLNEISVLTEDQSGAEVVVNAKYHATPLENAHVNYGSDNDKRECQARLKCAASIAERVRYAIHKKVGFTTTMGVSVSPMLSKFSSGLKKPNSVNILFPWRSGSLIPPMPLRKIPDLGNGTIKVLNACLQQTHHGRSPDFWTCRDLVQVPRHEILTCLERLNSSQLSSDTQCTMLLEKCRGVDQSKIQDDNGGLSKTVSVENSMKRGTILTEELVRKEVNELFRRLPRLLDERKSASPSPTLAFPNTLRLTVRVVDRSLQTSKRRPFITKSKQAPFDGNGYMTAREGEPRNEILLKVVNPLLRMLVLDQGEINVTRINLATTNFQDLKADVSPTSKSHFLASNNHFNTVPPLVAKRNENYNQITSTVQKRPKLSGAINASCDVIDPAVLAELPAAIAAEVRQMHKQNLMKKKANGRIDSFFARKFS